MVKFAEHTMTSALARAKAKVGKSNEVGMCAKEVIVNIFDVPPPWTWGGNGEKWAINFWKAAVEKGTVHKTSDPMDVPAGAMLFHAARPGAKATDIGGRAGHIAVGAGGGMEYSTDRPKNGKWGKVSISSVEKAWTKKLVGYILITADGYTLTDPVGIENKLEPAAYFLGAHGAHVTWLGERLVVHLKALGFPSPYAVGPGPDFGAADVKGVREFQLEQGWSGANADGFPGKETLRRLAADPDVFVPNPVIAAPFMARAATETTLMCTAQLNHSDYNKAHGQATAKQRAPGNAKRIIAFNPTVVCFQELAHGTLPTMDKAMKGYKRAKRDGRSGKGRQIYLRDDLEYVASGTGQVKVMLNGDDKPYRWCVYVKDGARCLEISFHNENQDDDFVQKAQMTEVLKDATILAHHHMVPRENVAVFGDSNEPTTNDFVETLGTPWKSAGHHAPVRKNDEFRSLNSWLASKKGRQIDVALVLPEAELVSWEQVLDSTNKKADHNLIITQRRVVIGTP